VKATKEFVGALALVDVTGLNSPATTTSAAAVVVTVPVATVDVVPVVCAWELVSARHCKPENSPITPVASVPAVPMVTVTVADGLPLSVAIQT
jgi:hypothetical protein